MAVTVVAQTKVSLNKKYEIFKLGLKFVEVLEILRFSRFKIETSRTWRWQSLSGVSMQIRELIKNAGISNFRSRLNFLSDVLEASQDRELI